MKKNTMAVRSIFCLIVTCAIALVPPVRAIFNNGDPFQEDVLCEVQGQLLGKECGLGECAATSTCRPKCCASPPLPPATDRRHGQRSRQACDQYKSSKNDEKCNYIINKDVSAAVGEFPFFTALGYANEDNSTNIQWHCGGGLISDYFVLTTAVCAIGTPKGGPPKWVLLGSVLPKEDAAGPATEARQKIAVAKAFVYPEYLKEKLSNDIGLVRLAQPARVTASVRPACLYTEREPPVNGAVVAGHGKTSGERFGKVNKVYLPFASRDKCQEDFQNKIEIDDSTMICAGAIGKDICQGDSGAPLVVKSGVPSCSYQILGASSFGKSICGSGTPSVFTRVYSYLPWIESIVWP